LALSELNEVPNLPQIKECATSYLLKFLTDERNLQDIDQDLASSYALHILKLILLGRIECVTIGEQLAFVIKKLFSYYSSSSKILLKLLVITNVTSHINESLIGGITDTYLLILQSLFGPTTDNYEISFFIQKILDSLILRIIRTTLPSTTIKTFIEINKNLLKKNVYMVNYFFYNDGLIKIIEEAITNKEYTLETILRDKETNELTIIALSFLKCLITNSYKKRLINSKIINVSQYLCLESIRALVKFNELNTKLVIELLSFLLVLLNDYQFYNSFDINRDNLFVNCLIPLLATNQSLELEASPEELVNLSLDICYSQKSKTLQTEAAKLLEGMCDRLDGGLRFMFDYCTRAITYACHRKSSKHYTFLNSYFIDQATPQLIIEVSITALCILSHSTRKRQDLL